MSFSNLHSVNKQYSGNITLSNATGDDRGVLTPCYKRKGSTTATQQSGTVASFAFRPSPLKILREMKFFQCTVAMKAAQQPLRYVIPTLTTFTIPKQWHCPAIRQTTRHRVAITMI